MSGSTIIEGSGGHFEGDNCWCGARPMQPCPEDCQRNAGELPCWKCGGAGLIPKEPDYDGDCVVVHTDERRE